MPVLPPRRLWRSGTLPAGQKDVARRKRPETDSAGQPMRPHRLFRARRYVTCWECSARRRMRRAPSMRRRKRILRCAAESTVSGRNSWFRRSNRPIWRHVRSSSAITATGFPGLWTIPPLMRISELIIRLIDWFYRRSRSCGRRSVISSAAVRAWCSTGCALHWFYNRPRQGAAGPRFSSCLCVCRIDTADLSFTFFTGFWL